MAAPDPAAARGDHQSARVVVDTDEPAIRELHAEGLSQGAVARRLGVDRPSLSRWSKRNALYWGPTTAGAMVAAETLRIHREQLAARALVDALHLRQQFWTEEPPTARDVRDLAAAIESLIRVSDHAATRSMPGVSAAKSMLSRLGSQLDDFVHDKYGDTE